MAYKNQKDSQEAVFFRAKASELLGTRNRMRRALR